MRERRYAGDRLDRRPQLRERRGTLQVDMAVKDGSGRQVDTFSTGRLPVGWKVKLI
jgi:hypothetical protein